MPGAEHGPALAKRCALRPPPQAAAANSQSHVPVDARSELNLLRWLMAGSVDYRVLLSHFMNTAGSLPEQRLPHQSLVPVWSILAPQCCWRSWHLSSEV